MPNNGAGKGSKCPYCTKATYHNKDTHYCCSSCGFIGWAWYQPVLRPGQGRGNRCPLCKKVTFHDIATLGKKKTRTIRRCATCNYTGIEPLSQAGVGG